MPILNTLPERAKALKPVVMDNVIAIVFHACFYANNSFCSHVQLTKGAYFLKLLVSAKKMVWIHIALKISE